MARAINLKIFIFIGILFLSGSVAAQQTTPKGKLFIIGGGEKSPELTAQMLETANLKANDYVAILPMASSIPDTVVMDIREEIKEVYNLPVIGFKFTKTEAQENKAKIDSVRKAKLIYITGGDQNRFMKVVKRTALHKALYEAYLDGATIAGTSAGAAVMSKIMLTGEPVKTRDFNVIERQNTKTAEGLGFLTEDIIDQHFIKRSRFNRLITVLSSFPDKQAIGIDESTAIICYLGEAKVVGDGQVVLLSHPQDLSVGKGEKIGFKNINFALLKAGDSFNLKTKKINIHNEPKTN